MDFLSLDGLLGTRVVEKVQMIIHYPLRGLLQAVGIDLREGMGQRAQFIYNRELQGSENTSLWGVLGFAFVWPLTLFAACRRTSSPVVRAFALAALLYGVVQAYTAPYDIWHGRYFTTAALFALPPTAGYLFPRRLLPGRLYVLLVIIAGMASALCAVCFRDGTPVFPLHIRHIRIWDNQYADIQSPSCFQPLSPRVEYARQLSRELSARVRAGIAKYEEVVPEHAVVMLDYQTGFIACDGLFFGKNFSRTLIPRRPFYGAPSPAPSDAEYLVFDNLTRRTAPRPGDILLWHDGFYSMYVRKLVKLR
jgi:hypothetical protein